MTTPPSPAEERRMSLDLHSRAAIYRPQYANLVYLQRVGSDYRRASASPGAYILATPNIREGVEAPPTDAGFEPEELERLRGILETLEQSKMPPPAANAILRKVNAALPPDAVGFLKNEARTIDTAGIDALFGGEQDQLRAVAMDRVEGKAALQLEGAQRLSALSGKEAILARLQALGIDDLVYVDDFPMLMACFGFKRQPEPTLARKARLQTYPRVGDDRDRFPLYVEPYRTEAIIFEVNPQRLAKFSQAWTGTSLDPKFGLSEDLQASCLAGLHKAELRDRIEQQVKAEQDVGACAWTVMHTMSHLAIKAASGLSGFNMTSLTEYMMPGAARFALMLNRTQESGIGGLNSMFQDFAGAFVDRLETIHQDCLHDPSCREIKAACHACLTISETSCRHMNAYLDRRIVYGQRGAGGSKRGFYEWRA